MQTAVNITASKPLNATSKPLDTSLEIAEELLVDPVFISNISLKIASMVIERFVIIYFAVMLKIY